MVPPILRNAYNIALLCQIDSNRKFICNNVNF